MEDQKHQDFEPMKQLAWVLSAAGLMPFFACTLLVLLMGMDNPISEPAIAIFRNYSVVILSFLGGIRWGYALVKPGDENVSHDRLSIALSVIPALVGWITMFMPLQTAIAVLLVAFCAQGAWDSLSASAGKLPQWFAPIRITLTLIVAICHVVIFLIAV